VPGHAGDARTPYGRYLVASLGPMAIATATGITRELTYADALGEDAAGWVSLHDLLAGRSGGFVVLVTVLAPLGIHAARRRLGRDLRDPE
jgi:hypothetical protein